MGSWGAVVSVGGARNCFIKIPISWTPNVQKDKLQVFQLQTPGGDTIFSTWQGDVSSSVKNNGNNIEVNGLYAAKQGIKDGTEVVVTKLDNVVFCERLFVEPLSVDDWEILELHAQWVEQHLLDQVRVVWAGQVFPLWVGGNICIFVKVETVEPASVCCMLEPTTELHIAPKDRHRTLPREQKSVDKKLTEPRHEPTGWEGTPSNKTTMDKPIRAQTSQGSLGNVPTIGDSNRGPEEVNEDFFHRLIGYFQSLLFGNRPAELEGRTQRQDELMCLYSYKEELLSSSSVCSFPLRIQPCGDLDVLSKAFDGHKVSLDTKNGASDVPLVQIAQQPTCVYVNLHSYCDKLNQMDKPTSPHSLSRTFLAILKPSKTPAEREEAITKTMLNKKPLGTEKKKSSSDDLPQTDDPEHEMCSVVRVILLDSDNTFSLCGPSGQAIAKFQFGSSKGPLPGHMMVSDLLRRQLSLQFTGVGCLQPLVEDDRTSASPADITGITLHPLFNVPSTFTEDMIIMAFKVWIRDVTCLNCPLVVSNGSLIKLFLKQDLHGEFLVTLDLLIPSAPYDPSHPAYCLLQLGALEDLKVKVGPRMTAANRPSNISRLPCWNLAEIDPKVPAVSLQQLGGVKDLYSDLRSHLAVSLAGRPLDARLMAPHRGQRAGMVLLMGPKGSGKSALARAVCRSLGELPTSAYVTVIDCKPLRGKRADAIQKQLHKAFTEAAWRQPAVLLLDDLDQVTAAPSGPEQEMSGEAVYYARIAEVLKDLLYREVVENSAVVVLATCRSQTSLHPTLTTSRGHHICQKVVHINPPDKAQREAMLEALLTFRSGVREEAVRELDLSRVASQTEGYVVRDLEQVVDRALHARRMARNNTDGSGGSRPLSDTDFKSALRGFTPMSLRHVTLHDSGDVTWSNVGGLHDVRRALVETLQWPSKYPQLFASCPLRLRAGLLLYGAPGTGKTLLAAAVAKECGLNFISIKGPELLSKYIGASEQAVRDTFERAQSAKPCILFFDEFDSLAPRRGHDNTGVTDRVVNQLLTQLDGVEGLEGVYVLTATSRPDLIDPALLRPGRLDKALHCTLPSESERVEILEALSRSMSLSDDVDLHQVAARCPYFTGADLKALLYNAQLAAIHETTDLWAGLRTGMNENDVTRQKPSVSKKTKSGLEAKTSFEYLLPESGSSDEGTRERNNSSVSEGSSGSDLSVGQSPSWEVVPVDGEKAKEKLSSDAQTAEVTAPENKIKEVVSAEVGVVEREAVSEPAGSRLVAYLPRLEEGAVNLTLQEQQEILSKYPETSTSQTATSPARAPVISALCQRHLVKAARTMQPSVSESERRKFERIYDHFVGSKGGGGFSGSLSEAGQRATLA